MKVMYQKPEVKVIKFDLENKVMDGIPNGEGDILEMPDTWQDAASTGDTSTIG